MKTIYLYYMSLLLITFGFISSSYAQQKWKDVKNTSENQDICRYLLENEHPTHVRSALKKYFKLYGCGSYHHHFILVHISNDSCKIFDHPVKTDLSTALFETIIEESKDSSSLLPITATNGNEQHILNRPIIIAIKIFNEKPKTRILKKRFHAIYQALMQYKNVLANKFYNTNYNNLNHQEQEFINTTIYSRITIIYAPPPPPPPLPKFEETEE